MIRQRVNDHSRIAATALVEDLILVTDSMRDFGATGASFIDPWDAD